MLTIVRTSLTTTPAATDTHDDEEAVASVALHEQLDRTLVLSSSVGSNSSSGHEEASSPPIPSSLSLKAGSNAEADAAVVASSSISSSSSSSSSSGAATATATTAAAAAAVAARRSTTIIPDHILQRYVLKHDEDHKDITEDETEVDQEDENCHRTQVLDEVMSSTSFVLAQRIGRTVLSVPEHFVKRFHTSNTINSTGSAAVKTTTATTPPKPIAQDISRVSAKEGALQQIQRKKKQHSLLCENIVHDQQGRMAVKELQDQCLQDMDEHLNMYLFEHDVISTTLPVYHYEHWIHAIHPENVLHPEEGGTNTSHEEEATTTVGNEDQTTVRIKIDPRFYLKGSHHRRLWNAYMQVLERTDAIINVRTMEVEASDPS